MDWRRHCSSCYRFCIYFRAQAAGHRAQWAVDCAGIVASGVLSVSLVLVAMEGKDGAVGEDLGPSMGRAARR